MPCEHIWVKVGTDHLHDRAICRCVKCGNYDFLDNLMLQETARRGALLVENDPSLLETPSSSESTTRALHTALTILLELERLQESEEARIQIETRILNAFARIKEARTVILVEWNRRSLANRVVEGETKAPQ